MSYWFGRQCEAPKLCEIEGGFAQEHCSNIFLLHRRDQEGVAGCILILLTVFVDKPSVWINVTLLLQHHSFNPTLHIAQNKREAQSPPIRVPGCTRD
jgi:hypothetical protein